MNKKIIVALDGNNFSKLIKLAKNLKNEVYAYKIGYEFFFNFGISGYSKIKKICPNIFLDLKLSWYLRVGLRIYLNLTQLEREWVVLGMRLGVALPLTLSQ